MDKQLEANRELTRIIQRELQESIKAIAMEMKEFQYKSLEKDKRDHKNDCNNK